MNYFDTDTLVSRFSCLRGGTYGRSVMGRPLRLIRFGAGSRTAIFTAAHHANEYLTASALLNCAEALARRYTEGEPGAAELYARTRLIFVPLVNPDGAALCTGALSRGAYYERAAAIAAQFPALSFPDGWKANISGTDLNLQYPAGWEAAKRIKYAQGWTKPAPRDYVGLSPLCAPEARALYALTKRLRPRCALALHSQGEVIYWEYRGYAPPGAEELAERLAAASGYALETVPAESANAGYKDYVIDSLDVPAFTVECGRGENPLPEEQLGGISAAVEAVCGELALWCAAT